MNRFGADSNFPAKSWAPKRKQVSEVSKVHIVQLSVQHSDTEIGEGTETNFNLLSDKAVVVLDQCVTKSDENTKQLIQVLNRGVDLADKAVENTANATGKMTAIIEKAVDKTADVAGKMTGIVEKAVDKTADIIKLFGYGFILLCLGSSFGFVLLCAAAAWKLTKM